MTGTDESPQDLRSLHESTYHSLRIGVLVIGALLPPALWVGGSRVDGIPLQNSMSGYYYTGMRDVFVGALCAAGVALFAYKGFSTTENHVLSLGGVLAVCVALFPTQPSGEPLAFVNVLHVVAAVGFFACLAYVSVFRASDTLLLVRDTVRARTLERWYRILGVTMIASPLFALAAAWLLRPSNGTLRLVFFLEAFGVWVFAVYWGVKSRELRETSAEQALAQGVLQRVERSAVPGRLRQTAALEDS